ncbi:hypothetical protein OSTOST_11464 [Ostertagia ostertagi]
MERHRTFKNSFYAIVIVFSMSVVVSSSCKLAYGFIIVLADVQSKGINCLSVMVDLAISYFSALLIFLLGLNRFAAFSSSYLYERLMKRRALQCVVFGLLVFSSVITVLIYKISGLRRSFSQDTMVDYADGRVLVQASNYIFYALPLFSSVFYLFAYRSLRSKREDVVSNATKSLLDKVERCTLNQGIWILAIYLMSLVIHIAMQLPSVDGTMLIVLSSLETLTSATPQVALPITVLMCSKEARNVTSRICWSAVKRSMSSVLSKRRTSSVPSSTKTLPVTLQIDS